MLDFSGNTICLRGAGQILRLALSYPHLKRISLASNRIYDSREEEDYSVFEARLHELLHKDTFEEVDVRNNEIANLSWFSHMTLKLEERLWGKISWEDEEKKSS